MLHRAPLFRYLAAELEQRTFGFRTQKNVKQKNVQCSWKFRDVKEKLCFTKRSSRRVTTWYIWVFLSSLVCCFSYFSFLCQDPLTTHAKTVWWCIIFWAKCNIKFTRKRNIIFNDHTKNVIFKTYFLRRSSFIFHPKEKTIFLIKRNTSFLVIHEIYFHLCIYYFFWRGGSLLIRSRYACL